MNAHNILTQAQKEITERGTRYDAPGGERNMDATVEAFNAITGHDLTVTQGWVFMAVLKAVRSQQGRSQSDSYVDGAAYFALAGESALEDGQ